MDEDEVLSKITRLLEQGCTMLATHHDCGAPLFRRQGEIVCPVCSFADESDSLARAPSVLTEAELDEKSTLDRAHLQERGAVEDLTEDCGAHPAHKIQQYDEELMVAVGNLRTSLMRRLRELTVIQDDEQDLDKLKKQLDCLEGLLRVLRSL